MSRIENRVRVPHGTYYPNQFIDDVIGHRLRGFTLGQFGPAGNEAAGQGDLSDPVAVGLVCAGLAWMAASLPGSIESP